MNKRIIELFAIACWLVADVGCVHAQTAAAPLGLFADHTDVGAVLHPGSVVYDPARRSYTITGSGENVWATADAFQFVWKKMEGDFTLSADVSILGQRGDPHKKAMLMARQSLDADSPYADVALHAAGLTSLQSRDAKGADTHEIQSNISAPKKLRLQKYRDEFTMWLAGDDGKFQMAGGSMRVPLTGPFYVGLGVCAHNKDAVETAGFGNVALGAVSSEKSAQIFSTLETIDIASTDRRVAYVASDRDRGSIVAPTWAPDGASLLFLRWCGIESVPVAGGEPKTILPTSALCAFELHGVSPDGTMLAVTSISHNLAGDLYLVPLRSGEARRATAQPTSIWLGWTPDGKSIIFLGGRDGGGGIYTVPTAGGEDTRVADTPPWPDNPDCTPGGKYIYFNSRRPGALEVWRMRLDGSQQEQVTQDGAGSYYPHVSPDGRLLAFLTPQQLGTNLSTAAFTPLTLRVMSLADGQIRVLANFIGHRGSMLSPSWSPDSRRLAFVSYSGTGAEGKRPQPPAPVVVK